MSNKSIQLKVSIMIAFLLIILSSCNTHEAKARKEFVENFDLVLKGQVLTIESNKFGQYLVCLEVIQSNHENYFPVYDPNKYRSDSTGLLDKRFFIKVQGNNALMILSNTKNSTVLHNKIKPGSIIEVNTDGKKGYDIYEDSSKKHLGGKYISTSPIRDNIENICLK